MALLSKHGSMCFCAPIYPALKAFFKCGELKGMFGTCTALETSVSPTHARSLHKTAVGNLQCEAPSVSGNWKLLIAARLVIGGLSVGNRGKE